MKGLNCNFIISGGKFQLSDGSERARDAIWMYSTFDRFRIYSSDYGANFISLLQRPTSLLVMNRTILLGIIRKGITKYVPNVKLKRIDMGYLHTDRSKLNLVLEYDIIGEEEESTEVIFI